MYKSVIIITAMIFSMVGMSLFILKGMILSGLLCALMAIILAYDVPGFLQIRPKSNKEFWWGLIMFLLFFLVALWKLIHA